jgi:hypothetical protein
VALGVSMLIGGATARHKALKLDASGVAIVANAMRSDFFARLLSLHTAYRATNL